MNIVIGIVGNCQSADLSRCFEAMLPDARIRTATYRLLLQGTETVEGTLNGSDLLFIQTPTPAIVTEFLERSAIPEEKTVFYPSFSFNGFHPDIARATHDGCAVRSPLGNYNSAIALYAWKAGVSREAAEHLFCEEVYEAIGYFNYWSRARAALTADARSLQLDLEVELNALARVGCFMHTDIHPRIPAIAALARRLIDRLALPTTTRHPENYIVDTMYDSIVWPVYPEIARRHATSGEYLWKTTRAKSKTTGTHFGLMTLPEFLDKSFSIYETLDREKVTCVRFSEDSFRRLSDFLPGAAMKRKASNPYRNLPDHQYWRRAVSGVDPKQVNPVVNPRFTISPEDRIATAGSCFAQHISRRLESAGHNFFVVEDGERLDPPERARRNFRVYSARYGNLYTARQLSQLFERAFGDFEPDDVAWRGVHGRWIDPFRPEIEPDGFESAEAVAAERAKHLSAVQTMFETLDIFVFTLGLTEAWRSKADGAVFPVCPGVVASDIELSAFDFVNFSATDVQADLDCFIRNLRRVNPKARVLLTVSPVPLVATFEKRHVLVSTTVSKAALRIAADNLVQSHAEVEYFPSYEIITGAFNRGAYFESDLRTVTESGVDHVMKIFLENYSMATPRNAVLDAEIQASRSVICEEELLET